MSGSQKRTRRPSLTFDPWDIAVVPFPFSERPGNKRRPALVLSRGPFQKSAGHSVPAMITTRNHSPWPGDTSLRDFESAGLSRPCLVRLKLFTLDNRLLMRRIGHLSARDRDKVVESLTRDLALS